MPFCCRPAGIAGYSNTDFINNCGTNDRITTKPKERKPTMTIFLITALVVAVSVYELAFRKLQRRNDALRQALKAAVTELRKEAFQLRLMEIEGASNDVIQSRIADCCAAAELAGGAL